jgi:hypothetical protein
MASGSQIAWYINQYALHACCHCPGLKCSVASLSGAHVTDLKSGARALVRLASALSKCVVCRFPIARPCWFALHNYTVACTSTCMFVRVCYQDSCNATLPSPLPLSRVGSGAILLHRANCSRQAGLAPAGLSGKVQYSTLPASCYDTSYFLSVLFACLRTCFALQ